MTELGMEYMKTADELKAHIQVLKERAGTARGEEYFSLLRRIETMKEEYYHTRTVGNYLLRSYGKE